MAKSAHLDRVLERRALEYKDDVAREVREYGQVRPREAQVGSRTWKSYSQIRFTSKLFRSGWERIFEHGK